ncbi:MAG TPA: serine/threonine-protein kinase [Candidatus Polarisedimenticolaceae bacterium]|nr:serine/threonine-protein kinase [Candidatus Polarisedimenticolaceae bacterium]
MAEGEGLCDPESTELSPPAAAPTPEDESQRIGPYRLLEKLGEGGMGEVWLAEQSEPVRRRVALKVIKRGMDTERVVARFEAERQALALMDHPAVAKVFDAGSTPRGRPYFAMEYVHGVPITEHCDRHRLTTRERLDLFVQVCDGVQHAHQKAILHRDLKPTNVLAWEQDGRRQPKIIDFGVAKATAQRLTEKSVYTELGVLIGTPEYMSPEQAALTGEDVDTRTDVYSLGVMLYELLVGALPFESAELREAGFEGVRRKICEEEPRRPSARLSTLSDARSTESARRRRVSLPALQRQLRGELDWIVMKALEKDRARRYGSPAELAADIERHLRNEVVLAGPPSAAYRARKFVRRHRLGVSLVAVGVLALSAFTATLAVQARRIAAERDRATRLLSYLKQVFEVSNPSEARGGEITARELLDKRAARIGDELAGQPELQAEMSATMGHVYLGLGLYDRAQPLLADALATRRRLLGDRHPDTLTSIYNLGLLRTAQGKHAEAEPLHREALEGRRRVLGNDHPDTLISINALGLLLQSQGKSGEAEPLYREALERSRSVLGNDHPKTLTSINNMGFLLQTQGKLAEAEPYWREALERRRRVLGNDHPETLTSISNLAFMLQSQGKLAEAEPYFREALEGRRRVLGNDHPSTLGSINAMGLLLQSQGRLGESEPYFREALEGHRRVLGREHPSTLFVTSCIGLLLLARGKLAEAEPYVREALEGSRRVLGDNHPSTLGSIHAMGLLLQSQGKLTEAESSFREALDGRRRILGNAHPNTLVSIDSLGTLLQSRGELAAAEPYLREALEGRRRVLGGEHPNTALSLVHLASLLNAQQRFADAEPLAREALDVLPKRLAAGHWWIGAARSVLGESLAGLGRHAEAEPLLLEGQAALSAATEPTAWHKREAVRRLVALYAAWHRPDDEARWRKRLSVPPT